MALPSGHISGVDFVTVPTDDFPAARDFYAKTLGLRCSVEYDRIPGGEFETGNLTIQLIDASAIGREFQAQRFPIALHVDDVAATRAELEGDGVSFHGDTIDSGVCYMAPFADPDGNVLMLHHRYAPRS